MNDIPSQSDSAGAGNPVADCLTRLRLGTPAVHRDVVVWPLFLPGDGTVPYRTLEELLTSNQARVTEVTEGGSVPELRVVNESEGSLLILDGEELIGAKQNRVVNTTLLLASKTATIIPVSCTEQGRWHSVSSAFAPSPALMEMKIRRRKTQSVSENLSEGSGPLADQGAVWEGIHQLQFKACFKSPTHAMKDVFIDREKDLAAALSAFPATEGQHGLVVSIGGQVVGCDLLSRADAYARVHAKLIRSYVLDALLGEPGKPGVDDASAREFLDRAAHCHSDRFPSVGCGESMRLRNERMAGAALRHEGEIIHLALFRVDPPESSEVPGAGMARLAQRRHRYGPPPPE